MKKNCLKLAAIVVLFLLPALTNAQSCDPLNAQQLKNLLTQMGYTVKDLISDPGKEKYEVDLTSATLNVPIAYEFSPSKNFIWLTVNLGKPKGDTSVANANLLKRNTDIQPCQFYITASGALMLGLAIENRGLTPAIMRRHTDKVVSDVSSTATLWQ
jgi:hypothetical protein